MEGIVAQDVEIIIYQDSVFNNLNDNSFVLVDISNDELFLRLRDQRSWQKLVIKHWAQDSKFLKKLLWL